MSFRAWALYGVLLVLAVAISIAAGSNGGKSASSTPSITSHGGGGLAALKEYLGDRAVTLEDPLNSIPKNIRTLVIAAPTARTISSDEITALDAWIRSGGRLVYLSPRGRGVQPELGGWLGLSDGERLAIEKLEDDPGGATAKIWAQHGVFSGVRQLRVAAARGVQSTLSWLLPIAGTVQSPVLLWGKLDRGEVIVAAGADVAENRRIELLDNAQLWDNLAADGPIAFDEFHHTAAEGPPMSVGILAFLGQAIFALAFLTFARGTRLGPPLPVARDRSRAGIEYARSFAWLVRGAHVEKELVVELERRLKRIVHERLGVPLSLPDDEFGRELEHRLPAAATAWSSLTEKFRRAERSTKVTDREFAAISTDAAELERLVRGERP